MLKNKYKAIKTEVDGIVFHSKKEAKRYSELKMLQKAGVVKYFIRQPMFDLPGKIKYYADFLVVTANGDITVEDVKGVKTKEFLIKKKLVEEFYPVKIIIV